jgi:hypothetical protein
VTVAHGPYGPRLPTGWQTIRMRRGSGPSKCLELLVAVSFAFAIVDADDDRVLVFINAHSKHTLRGRVTDTLVRVYDHVSTTEEKEDFLVTKDDVVVM